MMENNEKDYPIYNVINQESTLDPGVYKKYITRITTDAPFDAFLENKPIGLKYKNSDPIFLKFSMATQEEIDGKLCTVFIREGYEEKEIDALSEIKPHAWVPLESKEANDAKWLVSDGWHDQKEVYPPKTKLYVVFGNQTIENSPLKLNVRYVCEKEEIDSIKKESFFQITNVYEIEATQLHNFFDEENKDD